MLSGATAAERSLLTSFARGVRLWLEEIHGYEPMFQQFACMGRWQAIGEQKDLLEFVYDDFYSECDVAVIFGSWKARDKGSHITRTSVALNAKRFVVIETPLINRKTSTVNDHWRIGVNGFLNASAHWPDLAAHVADRKLMEWGVEWSGWQSNPEGHIVIALQLPGDASLRGIDINDWAYETVSEIRKHTDKPIVIRNHPLCSQRAFNDHTELAARLMMSGIDRLRFSDGYLIPWEQDLENAYCTVTYTSGLAVDSVLRGIPTVACDPGNFAWGVSTNSAGEILSLKMPDSATMMNWLRQLAGCQWSTEEMRDGKAWRALLPVLEAIK